MKPKDYHVIIIAAGKSRRLKALTKNKPKSLLEINGKRVIEYTLDYLNDRNFKRATMVVGFKRDLFIKVFGKKYRSLSIDYVISKEYATTGHGWSVYLTHNTWNKKPVILIHADIFYDSKILDLVIKSKYRDVISVDNHYRIQTNDECVVRGENNRITGIKFNSKNERSKIVGELIGINKWSTPFMSKFRKFMQDYFKEHGKNVYYEDIINAYVKQKNALLHYVQTGELKWININYPKDYEYAKKIHKAIQQSRENQWNDIYSITSVYSAVQIKKYIMPLLKKIESLHGNKTTVVGIQGGQGTGKTTLAEFLVAALEKLGFNAVQFSIDDFYTSYKARITLAKKYPENPFYQISRGMPGTHRVDHLYQVFKKLKQGKPAIIPIFNKWLQNAWGDISKKSKNIEKKQDFVIFEGWFNALPYCSKSKISKICEKNKIHLKKNDPKLKHISVVLQQLKKYTKIWSQVDTLIALKPKSKRMHAIWRYQKEAQMKKDKGSGMTQKQTIDYVDKYLPLTYACYELAKPDAVLYLDDRHRFHRLEGSLTSK